MSWTRKETVERFDWLLIETKKLMKRFSEEKEVHYEAGEDVTKEEIMLATEIIRRLGDV